MVSTTWWSFVAMTLTLLASSSLVTHSWLPSGTSAKRRGRLPTLMFFVTLPLATSTTCTRLATSLVT